MVVVSVFGAPQTAENASLNIDHQTSQATGVVLSPPQGRPLKEIWQYEPYSLLTISDVDDGEERAWLAWPALAICWLSSGWGDSIQSHSVTSRRQGGACSGQCQSSALHTRSPGGEGDGETVARFYHTILGTQVLSAPGSS